MRQGRLPFAVSCCEQVHEFVILLSNSNQQLRPISRQPYEREIRQLKGVLQQETQKNRRLAEKYQQQLEEMHKVCKVYHS